EVTITVVDDPDVNAFALPGNRIVVLRGLIDTAKDGDELAGILAHESAHLAHLDPVVGVIRNVGLSAIAHSLGMGGALAPKLGTRMLSLAYSRSVEARADRSAAAYLHAAGLRADGLARFFTRLQQLQGSDILPAFLSDHPPLAQRKTKMADDAAGVAALSPREWAAIRSMCGR
ncbi:MAG: M48 family metallopeptidase, partial [Candidatus Methylacidiphilaceae bacterium]